MSRQLIMMIILMSTFSTVYTEVRRINFSEIGATALFHPNPRILDYHTQTAEDIIGHHHANVNCSMSDHVTSTAHTDLQQTDGKHLTIDLRSQWSIETVKLHFFTNMLDTPGSHWQTGITVYTGNSEEIADMHSCGILEDNGKDEHHSATFYCASLHDNQYISVYHNSTLTTTKGSRYPQLCGVEVFGECLPCRRPPDTATVKFLEKWFNTEFVCGSRLIASCKPGFCGQERMFTCRNGTWNGMLPQCEVPSCSQLPVPSNGWLSSTNGNMLGSVVTLHCLPGFSAIASQGNVAQCVMQDRLFKPQWSAALTFCSKDISLCECPNSPRNGKIICPYLIDINSIAVYVCHVGYQLSTVHNHVLCKQDGNWSNETPRCHPVTCSTSLVISNGKLVVRNNTYGSRAEIQCKDGYERIGSRHMVCGKDERWTATGLAPVCKRVDPGNCPMLEDPVNGRVVYSSTVVGSQAQYYCNLGYELLSDRETTRTCVSVRTTDRAVWTSDIPLCRAKLCPALDVPVNGEVKGDSFRYNRTVEYKCNHGYELVYGDRSRRCTASGQWTGVAPRCKHVCAIIGHSCGSSQECIVDQDGRAGCNCVVNSRCPSWYEPVCGNDGKTYSNRCLMALAGCREYNDSLQEAAQSGCQFGANCYSERPQAPPGVNCRLFHARFWFNSTAGRCEKYFHGECYGQRNSFYTIEDCQSTCTKANICQQPRDDGRCLVPSSRFYYNLATGRCEGFQYNGCFGNENNFKTIEQCEMACARSDSLCSCSSKLKFMDAKQLGMTGVVLKVTSDKTTKDVDVVYKARLVSVCYFSTALSEGKRKVLRNSLGKAVVRLIVREKDSNGCLCPSLARGKFYKIAVHVGQTKEDYITLTLPSKFFVKETDAC